MGVGERFIVSDDGSQMTLVFGECNLAVHSLNDFVVINLLLNVEFGQFG